MSLIGKKKKKVKHYHSTVYQAKITEYQIEFIDSIYSKDVVNKLTKLDKKIGRLLKAIEKEGTIFGSPETNMTYLVLKVKLNTLQTLIEMIIKKFKEYEEMNMTSEVNTKETTGNDNNIQYS